MYGGRNRNGNDKQLEHNACMLAVRGIIEMQNIYPCTCVVPLSGSDAVCSHTLAGRLGPKHLL